MQIINYIGIQTAKRIGVLAVQANPEMQQFLISLYSDLLIL